MRGISAMVPPTEGRLSEGVHLAVWGLLSACFVGKSTSGSRLQRSRVERVVAAAAPRLASSLTSLVLSTGYTSVPTRCNAAPPQRREWTGVSLVRPKLDDLQRWGGLPKRLADPLGHGAVVAPSRLGGNASRRCAPHELRKAAVPVSKCIWQIAVPQPKRTWEARHPKNTQSP